MMQWAPLPIQTDAVHFYLAMEVQRSLLPSRMPQIEGLDIAGESIYRDETGGDYYDFIDTVEQGLGKTGWCGGMSPATVYPPRC
jgi:hypothetical protein